MKIFENEELFDVLVIAQQYDTRYMLLAITEGQSRINQYYENLKKRTRESPTNMMEFNETIRHPMGVLYLNINKIIDFEVPDNTFIRIELEPYLINTRHVNKNKHGDEFRQRFYIPIHNHFNELKLDILFAENEGWFREKRKEQIIASISIPLPNLGKIMKIAGGNNLKIPFKVENKKLLSDIKKGKYSKTLEKSSKSEIKDRQGSLGKLKYSIKFNPIHFL